MRGQVARIGTGVLVLALVSVVSLNGQTLAIDAIHLYQRDLSSIAARMGARCRLTPTCSRYGEIVIARDGLVRGGWELAKRLTRCGPWTRAGTVDEP